MIKNKYKTIGSINLDKEPIVEMSNNKRFKLNKEILELIGEKISPKFAVFLLKQRDLKKLIKRLDVANYIVDYIESNDEKAFENLFYLIGEPLLDFYMSKVFNIKNKIKGKIPFLKSMSTGNFEIDEIIQDTYFEILNDEVTFKNLKRRLKDYLTNIYKDVYQSDNFKKAVDELYEETNNLRIVTEKNKVQKVWSSLNKKNKISKLKAIEKIKNYIPSLNRKYRRAIRKSIFNQQFSTILQIVKQNDKDKLALIIAPIIWKTFNQEVLNTKFAAKEFPYIHSTLMDILSEKYAISEFYHKLSKYLKNK